MSRPSGHGRARRFRYRLRVRRAGNGDRVNHADSDPPRVCNRARTKDGLGPGSGWALHALGSVQLRFAPSRACSDWRTRPRGARAAFPRRASGANRLRLVDRPFAVGARCRRRQPNARRRRGTEPKCLPGYGDGFLQLSRTGQNHTEICKGLKAVPVEADPRRADAIALRVCLPKDKCRLASRRPPVARRY